ncbi:hypothetical protein DJ568_13315 [Mucilaginibacter hurinus]|uniref:Lipoprotein n=1 Tax=Mucilaginibacter hurinus TaxID=2201324 RepID=A0A367GLR2_9SPHI|nr:hypothetical protein [Mucilaginibacter hurinus]RCH54270.1 hypothetical protein DJ568_13315 [Mucilaginibacter hurinus]
MKMKNFFLLILLSLTTLTLFTNCTESGKAGKADSTNKAAKNGGDTITAAPGGAPLDTALYDSLMVRMANGDTTGRWPVKKAPYPLPGAILPFKRVVAFYGNLFSKKMGILGEIPSDQMLAKLKGEAKAWERADPKTPVQPALHYIAVVAQGDGGKDGKYRYRMPFKQIDTILYMAKKIDAIVFLDIQVALSTIQAELPLLEKYLSMPNVHLGIDPEFSMKDGTKPGKKIGTYDAADINYVSGYLADLVKKNGLPPKIFVVHRFTHKMVTNYKNIKTRPEVQFVMHMDGWGEPELKLGTYRNHIFPEPVQFTGFKLFYKNDLKKAPHRMLTPPELVKYKPAPMYIQYQ